MPTNLKIGHFVEVDLEYLANINDQNKNYLLVPVKEIVLDAWLSEFQFDIKERLNIPLAKVSKLLHTMYDKKRYVFTSSYYSYMLNLECALLGCTACYSLIKNNGWNTT